MRRNGLTLVEILVIVAILGVLAAILLPALSNPYYSPHPRACVNFQKQLGLILNLYASEHEGRYPPIDNTKNNFIFDANVLYPEYMTDASVAACPQDPDSDPATMFRLRSTADHPDSAVGDVHPDCVTDDSYCYLGWLVTSDEEAEAFFEAYDKLSREDYKKDIVVPEGRGNDGGTVLHRLETNAERFLPKPAEAGFDSASSIIPILWDRPFTNSSDFSHRYDEVVAGNVLYLDGHVEFVKFGEKFPMTETMARLLEERPRAPIPDCDG